MVLERQEKHETCIHYTSLSSLSFRGTDIALCARLTTSQGPPVISKKEHPNFLRIFPRGIVLCVAAGRMTAASRRLWPDDARLLDIFELRARYFTLQHCSEHPPEFIKPLPRFMAEQIKIGNCI
jgi:hypothetical protein